MGLAARFRRLIRALFGGWMERIEDPVLILKQNIRDLNEQVPRMNENIAMIRANLTLLETQRSRLEEKIDALKARIAASLKVGRRDMALNYATTLEEVRENLEANGKQIELARKAYDHALKIKKAFMVEKERKTREAIRAIREAERARWEREIAGALAAFDTTGIHQTHEEMIARVEAQAAKDHAYLDLALRDVDDKGIEIEEEVRRLEANEIVSRFEREMGLTDSSVKSAGAEPDAAPDAAPDVRSEPPSPAPESPETAS